jgi:MATE family multidrug resistance protein
MLSLPVLFSLVAEPLTGLVDTAFVSRLGVLPLAALGVGTMVMSSVFWVFNLLGVSSQTEAAQALGSGDTRRASRIMVLTLILGLAMGTTLTAIGLVMTDPVAGWMGAKGEMKLLAVQYMKFRWLGSPAVVLMLGAFGVFRGLQDMRTPLWISLAVNLLNIVLDALLIFGLGFFPALGIQGAAIASTVSQWVGAVWALAVLIQRLGLPASLRWRELGRLLRVGSDLFIRTGLLTLFLLLATRTATRLGAEAGAAHQAIRQFWLFAALLLDASAITGQSLVGFFLGAENLSTARHVAKLVCGWSLLAGIALAILMLLGEKPIAALLAPPSAWATFWPAWRVAALAQPLNAVAFATDGIHWGAGDFAYLRNAAIGATVTGVCGLLFLKTGDASQLIWVWWITAGWITVRGGLGVIRVWPGIGHAPMRLDGLPKM